MSSYQSGNMAGEMWVQWFSCCVNQPAAQRVSHHVIQLHFVLMATALTDCTSQKIRSFQNNCFKFATTFFCVGGVAGAIPLLFIWQFYSCIYLKILFLMSC
jgi:hypothetical protein